MTTNKTSITIKFEKDEDKKHSIRFKEVGEDGHLKTIYVSRSTLKQLGNPDGNKPLGITLMVVT